MSLRNKSIFSKYLSHWELIFGGLWVMWVIITYLGHHPQYFGFLEHHPYAIAIKTVTIGAFIIAITGYFKLRKSNKILFPIRGLSIIGLVVFLATLILFLFRKTVGLDQESLGSLIAYFAGYSLMNLSILLFLSLAMLAMGSFLTDQLHFAKKPAILTIAFGFSVIGFIIAILALLSIYTKWIIWPIIILALFFKRKLVFDALKDWLFNKHQWKIVSWWELPMAFIALVFVSFYWVGSLKAYALGFDGTSLYANLAHITANNGSLPGSIQPYAWSLIMSLGECLFNSEVINLLLSHFMYVPALIMGYHIARMYLKPSYSLLAMIISLSMPFMGFHAMVDEKVDLGVLFISLSVIYLAIQWFFTEYSAEVFKFKTVLKSSYYYPLILISWLLGFAFTIKFTVVFLLIGLVTTLLYRLGNKWIYFGSLGTTIGLVFVSGFYRWGNIEVNTSDALILGVLFIVSGLGIMALGARKNNINIRTIAVSLAILGAVFILPFLPWGIKHLSTHNYSFSIENIMYGRPDRPNLEMNVELSFNHNIPPVQKNKFLNPEILLTSEQNEQTRDKASNNNRRRGQKRNLTGDSKREELQRYIGYENGLWRYTSIPFDLPFTINLNELRHQEIGFILLALLPLLLFGFGGHKKKNLFHLLIALGLILWVSNSYWTLTESSTLNSHLTQIEIVNTSLNDSMPERFQHLFDYYENIQLPFVYLGGLLSGIFKSISTLPSIFYFPVLFLMLFSIPLLLKKRSTHWPQDFKHLLLFSFAILTMWVLLGNSITWYAFPLLIILPILAVFYYQRASKFQGEDVKRFSKKLIGTVIFLQLSLNTFILFTSPYPNIEEDKLFQWPMIEYVCHSDIDRTKVHQDYNPTYYKIIEEINKHPEAKVYRINTYLQYHIENNNHRVYQDNQLGRFDRICSRLTNETDIFKVLKNNGYKYILYDFNTPALDNTPEQSLLAKCKKMYRLIKKSPDVSLLITDHYVEDADAAKKTILPNGKKAKAKQGLYGEVIYAGSIALFEIK